MTLFAGSTGKKSLDFINKLKKQGFFASEERLLIENAPFLGCVIESDNCIKNDDFYVAVLGGQYGQNELRNIWQSYQQGKDYLALIHGGFVLILADYRKQKLVLAIDIIGQKSLYYAQTSTGLVFGSHADVVIAHPDVSNEISSQSIYDYVYFHQCPSPNTIYSKVKKLEGCQVLSFQNELSLDYYWQPEFKEKLNASLADTGQELQATLVDSVRRSVTNIDETGAFLSGGLDSSSVVGSLSKVFPGQAKSFSMGFAVDGYDEIEYARMAVERFNTQQYEYYVTPADTVNAISDIAAYYDEPFGNSSALATYYCAKLAKENGVNTLLAGDGGDELFAGNERYTTQMLFEKYYLIPKPLRNLLKTCLFNLSDPLLKNKILFKGKRYIEQAEVPLPDRLQDYNFLHRHLAQEIFTEDFVQQIDTSKPLQSLGESYHRPESGASTLNRMLFMDWKSTLHDNDLVKVNRMTEMVGVDVAYPLLDKDVVSLSCSIPSDIKIKNRKLRWFYKQSMQGFLPDTILNKPKHGFGLPFGIWLKDHQPLKELAYDSINSLKKRPYFRAEFLDHAIEMHQSVHAAYYGELVWVLMMLELWFQGKKL